MTSLIMDYVQLADLKAHLTIPLATTTDDAILAVCITAASRAVDQATDRRFGQSAAVTDRLFTWHGECVDGQPLLVLDDVSTSTGVVVRGDTLGDYSYSDTFTVGTDVDLYPFDAAEYSLPWTGIVLRRNTTALFTKQARGMKVTARWGWAAIPSVVEIATLIQAARYFMRRDSWAGIAGSPELGSEIRLLSELDPDVQQLVQSVRRWSGA